MGRRTDESRKQEGNENHRWVDTLEIKGEIHKKVNDMIERFEKETVENHDIK